jgi:hypothetical protein
MWPLATRRSTRRAAGACARAHLQGHALLRVDVRDGGWADMEEAVVESLRPGVWQNPKPHSRRGGRERSGRVAARGHRRERAALGSQEF